MDYDKIHSKLLERISKGWVFRNEPMSKHTSFKIGGPADILVMPRDKEEVASILSLCNEENMDLFIMGNGSNLLVRDKGIRGIVVKLAENFSNAEIVENKVRAQSGILLSALSKLIANKSLKGFEFANGIPGTLGGAVAMNAGAYGGEISDVITGALVADRKGELCYLNKNELELGYRTSIIQKKNYIVLEADLEFQLGNMDEIKETISELTEKRTTKQPLHLPSAGSTFKRPPGHFAGKLIEEAGLKGVRFGGAQVSELHSGFIVNVDNACSEDVLNLIGLVQKVVRDKYHVELQPEVRIVGEA